MAWCAAASMTSLGADLPRLPEATRWPDAMLPFLETFYRIAGELGYFRRRDLVDAGSDCSVEGIGEAGSAVVKTPPPPCGSPGPLRWIPIVPRETPG